MSALYIFEDGSHVSTMSSFQNKYPHFLPYDQLPYWAPSVLVLSSMDTSTIFPTIFLHNIPHMLPGKETCPTGIGCGRVSHSLSLWSPSSPCISTQVQWLSPFIHKAKFQSPHGCMKLWQFWHQVCLILHYIPMINFYFFTQGKWLLFSTSESPASLTVHFGAVTK